MKESNNTSKAIFKRLQTDKLNSVDLPQQISINKTPNNIFFNSFKHTSMALYGYPIRVKLYDLKMSKKAFIKLLASNGLIYEYYLMCAVLEGRATSNFSINYFCHLYKALDIQLNIDTLCSSVIRWNEIKEYKKNRAIENKLKLIK